MKNFIFVEDLMNVKGTILLDTFIILVRKEKVSSGWFPLGNELSSLSSLTIFQNVMKVYLALGIKFDCKAGIMTSVSQALMNFHSI